MAIYLDYDGIAGNVTANGFENHIALLSVKFESKRTITMKPGALANRECSRPRLSELILTKVADIATPMLLKESVAGSAGKQVTVKFVHTGSQDLKPFLEYTLEDCLISGYLFDDKLNDPIERVKLSYSKILATYHSRDSSNVLTSPLRSGYDLTSAVSL